MWRNEYQAHELLSRYFSFLVDEFDFQLIEYREFTSFGNWVIVVQSDLSCRIMIMLDRGVINISFGPNWYPPSWQSGPWYSINFLRYYLFGITEQIPFNSLDIESQLNEASIKIKSIIHEVCKLLSNRNYEINQEKLDSMNEKFGQQIWDNSIS